ncbi:MAG: subclass B1 metallo-beta-lactamase [Pseudomonadota bacterium]
MTTLRPAGIFPGLLAAFALLTTPAAQAGLDDGKLQITELADGLYLHTSYKMFSNGKYFPSNGLIVVDGTDAWVIDSPWPVADTPALVAWINERDLTLRAVLATHSHDDRTSGFAWLNDKGIDTVALIGTNRFLKVAGKATATREFDGQTELLPGKIEAFYPGSGHTPDNVVVWLPEHKLLYGGCFVKSLGAKTLGNVADARVNEWQASLATVTRRYPDIETVVPGHGAVGDTALLRHTGALVEAALQK